MAYTCLENVERERKRDKLYPKRQGPKKPTEKRHLETTRPLPGAEWGWGGLCALGGWVKKELKYECER